MVKIVYAGLLGVAQDIKSLIQDIDFEKLGAELHIYGGGNQKEDIKRFITEHTERGIFYHGYVEPSQLREVLLQYDAALIPLATYIKGAVPSRYSTCCHWEFPSCLVEAGREPTSSRVIILALFPSPTMQTD